MKLLQQHEIIQNDLPVLSAPDASASLYLQNETPLESVCKTALMNYKNKHVIERYCNEYNKPIKYGDELFEQLMKWLYASYKLQRSNAPPLMLQDLLAIDLMWHTFILFTKDYASFCYQHFGYFIHHIPKTEDLTWTKDEWNHYLKQYFWLVAQEFGESTLIDWFKDKKYA